MVSRGTEWNSPSKVVHPGSHSARISASPSSVRRPRVPKLCPMSSNSSRHHPTPTPSVTRLPESTAAVPTVLATCRGWRSAAT